MKDRHYYNPAAVLLSKVAGAFKHRRPFPSRFFGAGMSNKVLSTNGSSSLEDLRARSMKAFDYYMLIRDGWQPSEIVAPKRVKAAFLDKDNTVLHLEDMPLDGVSEKVKILPNLIKEHFPKTTSILISENFDGESLFFESRSKDSLGLFKKVADNIGVTLADYILISELVYSSYAVNYPKLEVAAK